jgi:hypothetical protein
VTATVTASWGGYQVNHVVANALARARARAAARGDTVPGLADVAAVVLATPASFACVALTAAGVSPAQIALALPEPSGGDTAAERDDLLTRLLAAADRERRRSHDPVIGSAHLTAALAGSSAPELAPLRAAGIDLDLLRTGAARARTGAAPARTGAAPAGTGAAPAGIETPGDQAFAAAPAPAPLRPPAIPSLDDLATRTRMRRSAALKQILDSQMPAGSNAVTSPYGKTRGVRWARMQVLRQLLVIVTLSVAARLGVRWGSVPIPLWPVIVVIAGGAVAVWAPLPVTACLVATAATGVLVSWYELWMKRVDRGAPGLTMRELRDGVVSTGMRLLLRRMGVDDDS